MPYDLDYPIYQLDYKPPREPVDRVTDEMLTKPLKKLTPAEWGILRRAIKSERAEEIVNRAKLPHGATGSTWQHISKDVI